MIYLVLIAICAVGTPVAECDSTSAVHWIAAPEPQMLAYCGIHGQQYAAQSRLVDDGAYVKIFCRPLNLEVKTGER